MNTEHAPGPIPAPVSTDPLDPAARRRRWPWVVGTALVVLLGTAEVIGYPNYVRSRINANESAAMAVLKNISSGQAQMQASAAIDVDGDGSGESAFFAEMAGSVPMRAAKGAGRKLEPPVLAPRFGVVVDGCVHACGYCFRMYLRGVDGSWVSEAASGGAGGASVDPDRTEIEWLCYAWPEVQGSTGVRVFMMNQSGDIMVTNQPSPDWSRRGPAPGAGYVDVAGHGKLAQNCEDSEGRFWTVG